MIKNDKLGLSLHPGKRIRQEVIPSNVTVSKAAEILGVSRPALSNLLNGRASLSADMAVRLEAAFGRKRNDLLKMQSDYDTSRAQDMSVSTKTTRYVAPFLEIKANDIEVWADTLSARGRLAVLLRTLVHSTASNLSKVDFPGNDDSQRPGWDGQVENSEATPWIPEGQSGWEFGVNQNVKSKADDDFDKSVKAVGKKDRLSTTFVFVTPRRWSGKAAWLKAAKSKREWKEVVAYDASDLEQWIEQSTVAQAWFSRELGHPAEDVRTLEHCWADWADVATPSLVPMLFTQAIDDGRRTLLSQLNGQPNGPIVIAADSTEEALAFLAQVFASAEDEKALAFRDRMIVFDKPGVLPRLLGGAVDFVPVVHTREVERELSAHTKKLHTIVVYPTNLQSSEAHIVLKPIDHDTFRKSLESMGQTRDEIGRLSSESGHSLTVLRRRLATVPAIKKPEWVTREGLPRKLIPLAFVGSWDSSNPADQSGVTLIADVRTYEEVEKTTQELRQFNDAPMWSVGRFRGVVSKIDAIYALAPWVTRNDLEQCFSLARLVLGEDDPSLDLPESERWAASIHGKTREFSGAFRKGVAETFVFLAVHGNSLFKATLGVDCEVLAAKSIRELLGDPLDPRKLEAADRDLPTYAEAAPDAFLQLIEEDLTTAEPQVMRLMRPAGSDHFGGGISRSGLLWALEGLSWNPETLHRASIVLAQLSKVEINDNWMNKPINSLKATFSSWMPQTAANHDTRVAIVKKILARFPEIGWQLCISQFGGHSEIGHYSHKPKWRSDGYGVGEPFKLRGPIIQFIDEMVQLALTRTSYTSSMICDLIGRIHGLRPEDQEIVWGLVKRWAEASATENEMADVREKIRTSVLSRRAAKRLGKSEEVAVLTASAKSAYDALEPTDVVQKHAWLFKKNWVEDSADEIYDDAAASYEKREERIRSQRSRALNEILETRSFGGIIEAARLGEASWQVGWLTSTSIVSPAHRIEFFKVAVAPVLSGQGTSADRNLCAAFLFALKDDDREKLILEFIKDQPEEAQAAVLRLAPFSRPTWELLERLGREARRKYWAEVHADWIRDSREDSAYAVRKLLEHKRPRAAFACINLQPQQVDVSLLSELLCAIAAGGEENPEHYPLEGYHIQEAMKLVSASQELTLDEKAILEYRYLEVLSKKWGEGDNGSLANLEKYIELHPELYVQAVVWTYRRKDRASDPEEYRVPEEQVAQMADRGYKLLNAMSRMPGHDKEGKLESERLLRWIKTVRNECERLSRAVIADQCLGKLISCAPVGADGVWPCEPVRDALEELHAEEVMRGACIGLFNSRGVHWRGEGGAQEREIANKYRAWAEKLQHTHPFVHDRLLMEMARRYERDAQNEDLEAEIQLRMQ